MVKRPIKSDLCLRLRCRSKPMSLGTRSCQVICSMTDSDKSLPMIKRKPNEVSSGPQRSLNYQEVLSQEKRNVRSCSTGVTRSSHSTKIRLKARFTWRLASRILKKFHVTLGSTSCVKGSLTPTKARMPLLPKTLSKFVSLQSTGTQYP